MGVVYYANHLVWFEVARADWLRERGWTYREMEAEGLFLPVVEAQCQYRRPARYDDEIEIRTEGRLSSPLRIEFVYDVMRKPSNERLASGKTMHAAIDRTGRPCRLPDRILEAMA